MPVFPPNFLPPIIYPSRNFVNTNQFIHIIPHIHPSHTTTVNQHLFKHVHYCPQTCSAVEQVCHQHINCCPGMPRFS